MADTSPGFRFSHRIGGGPPTILNLLSADTGTLTKGDIVSLDTGELDLGATNDSAFLGAVLETKAVTDSVTKIEVYVDADAVYAVYDATARLAGATLDIAGTTGVMTVAATSNADFTVVAPSAADEETLVMFTHGEHAFN